MSLRAVVGVRAARLSKCFFSQRNQKHFSDMTMEENRTGQSDQPQSVSRLCNTVVKCVTVPRPGNRDVQLARPVLVLS
jgi:hypothetical protein